MRCFLPEESEQAFALALHGDWFDPSERLPDWLSRAAVLTVDPPLTLLDTGAWIEKYRDSTGSVKPNGRLSVICGNDVRIHQFDQR